MWSLLDKLTIARKFETQGCTLLCWSVCCELCNSSFRVRQGSPESLISRLGYLCGNRTHRSFCATNYHLPAFDLSPSICSLGRAADRKGSRNPTRSPKWPSLNGILLSRRENHFCLGTVLLAGLCNPVGCHQGNNYDVNGGGWRESELCALP